MQNLDLVLHATLAEKNVSPGFRVPQSSTYLFVSYILEVAKTPRNSGFITILVQVSMVVSGSPKRW